MLIRKDRYMNGDNLLVHGGSHLGAIEILHSTERIEWVVRVSREREEKNQMRSTRRCGNRDVLNRHSLLSEALGCDLLSLPISEARVAIGPDAGIDLVSSGVPWQLKCPVIRNWQVVRRRDWKFILTPEEGGCSAGPPNLPWKMGMLILSSDDMSRSIVAGVFTSEEFRRHSTKVDLPQRSAPQWSLSTRYMHPWADYKMARMEP